MILSEDEVTWETVNLRRTIVVVFINVFSKTIREYQCLSNNTCVSFSIDW